MNKPIPAFYACYLLRSTVRHASLYVGSTPNPIRRLRQHNGDTKGGAVRTSRDSLRPWEMTCLVTGFPSKVAALQFEWAWQNTHLTRHISPNTRITQSRTNIRISPKTGRPRKRPARPRLSLTDRLANLHLLLRASSFERWPLNVTFYSEDVFKVWQKWTQQTLERLRPGIEVTLDEPARVAKAVPPAGTEKLSGIPGIDVGYVCLKQHLGKAKTVLSTNPRCSICTDHLPSDGAMTLVCPNASCNSANHLSCLAPSFTKQAEDIVPTTGQCPKCSTKLRWMDLVKELSLRMRGEAEVAKLFKVRKARGKKNEEAAGAALVEVDEVSEDDEMVEEELPYLSISEDSDLEGAEPAKQSKGGASGSRLFTAPSADPFIEDSDWEDAEIIT